MFSARNVCAYSVQLLYHNNGVSCLNEFTHLRDTPSLEYKYNSWLSGLIEISMLKLSRDCTGTAVRGLWQGLRKGVWPLSRTVTYPEIVLYDSRGDWEDRRQDRSRSSQNSQCVSILKVLRLWHWCCYICMSSLPRKQYLCELVGRSDGQGKGHAFRENCSGYS